MTSFFLFSHNKHSAGAAELCKEMNIKAIRAVNSAFKGNPSKTIINWGAARLPDHVTAGGSKILNMPVNLVQSVDKAVCFGILRNSGVRVPDFTTALREAVMWLEGGHHVFARKLLRASSGRGIAIMSPDHPDTWDEQAPLYVKYVNKRHEYRIHVMQTPDGNYEVIDRQRKGLAPEFQSQEDINWKVRNMANGFIFVRNDGHQFPADADQQAINAVRATGLHFGAVDIIWNDRQAQAYVLEINSAPGLVGSTVESYAKAFTRNFK